MVHQTIQIAPSILSANFLKLGDEIIAAERAGADMIHVDVMDGHFVPNITIGPFIVEFVRSVSKVPLDVHLMIEHPDMYLEDFIKAGADYLTVHCEAATHLHRTVQIIKEHGIKAGVSLNPATSVTSLEQIVSDVDMILVMSVNPGFGGQSFIRQSLDKIALVKKIIKEKKSSALLEVDGGVKLDNAREIVSAGADVLVMGSAFFNSDDYGVTVKKLRDILSTG